MFLLQTDRAVREEIDFLNIGIIPKDADSYKQRFRTIPDNYMQPVRMKEYTIFPDVFTTPFPMVSDMVMDVMQIYRVEPFSKRMVLVDGEKNQYKTYHLLYIEKETISLYQDFVLNWKENGTVNFTISLDFAESILRRNAQGIGLKEIEEQEDIVI